MKTLSICVPTYNRRELLNRLLKNIREEAKGIEGEIEVCISDNGSDDGTRDYLEKNWRRAPFEIKFFFSGKNEGFDANVLRVLRMGSGKYLWTLGDDDGIARGSLRKLLGFLNSLDEDAIKVVYLRGKFKNQKSGEKRLPQEGPPKFATSYELVTTPIAFMGFIVYKREAIQSLDQKFLERGLGTQYMHNWALRLIGLKFPDGKAIFFEPPTCLAVGPEQSTSLSGQLMFSKVIFQQFWELFWAGRSSPRFTNLYLAFTLKKLILSTVFPFFEILCERVFRGRRKERLSFGFFIKNFWIFGPLMYAYYMGVRILPGKVDGIFLRLVLAFLKATRLTRETDYGYWKRFWGKKGAGYDFWRQETEKVQ